MWLNIISGIIDISSIITRSYFDNSQLIFGDTSGSTGKWKEACTVSQTTCSGALILKTDARKPVGAAMGISA
jgi:hypothetical protein